MDMISNALMSIFYVELMLSVLNVGLLLIEINTMKNVLRNSKTLMLIGFLLSYSSLTILRAWGIITNNPSLRQYGPSISGLLACIFLVLWGSNVMKIPKIQKIMIGVVSALGMMIFMLGKLFEYLTIQYFGVILTLIVIITFVGLMFKYVFTESPYIRARHRIFLLSVSFVFLGVFEGLGVYYMSELEFIKASISFLFIFFVRFGFNLSILLPLWLKPYLKKIA